MNDETLRESLSALVDGELSRAQAERVLDALSRDPALREQWRRHHLISAVLCGDGDVASGADGLAQRVAAGLDAAPVLSATRRVPRRGRSWVPVALAASLALAAVLASLAWLDPSGNMIGERPVIAGDGAAASAPDSSIADATPSGTAQGNADAVARARMTWNDTRPAIEARLNAYLLNHNEYLAGGVRGMLPYARVVGYDARD